MSKKPKKKSPPMPCQFCKKTDSHEPVCIAIKMLTQKVQRLEVQNVVLTQKLKVIDALSQRVEAISFFVEQGQRQSGVSSGQQKNKAQSA